MGISMRCLSTKEGTDYKNKSFLIGWRAYKQNALELWRLILYGLLNKGKKWTVREFPRASGLKRNTTDMISANIWSGKEADIRYYSHIFYLIPFSNQTKVLPLVGHGCPEPTKFQGWFQFFHTKNIVVGTFPWIKWDISNTYDPLQNRSFQPWFQNRFLKIEKLFSYHQK